MKKPIEIKPRITIEWHKSVKKPPEGGAVYRLWFGDKFYIGRSRAVRYRLKSHQSSLRVRLVSKKPVQCHNDFYQFVIAHLLANPDITVAYMEILELCNDDAGLVASEQKYFDKYIWDKRCLNLGFVAIPYKEPAETKVREHEHKVRQQKQKAVKPPKRKKVVKKAKKPVFMTNQQKLRGLRKLIKKRNTKMQSA